MALDDFGRDIYRRAPPRAGNAMAIHNEQPVGHKARVVHVRELFQKVPVMKPTDADPMILQNAGTHQGKRACAVRSEAHTSELQSLMRISYAVFCLYKKNQQEKLTT